MTEPTTPQTGVGHVQQSPGNAAEAELRLALLEDANSWAQHFSSVRLAVVTFLSGISLGIMNFRWDHPEWVFVLSALGTWAVGGALFVLFSLEQYRKLNQRRRCIYDVRRALGEDVGEPPSPVKLSVQDRILKEWWHQQDLAYAGYFILTAVFLGAWCVWMIGGGEATPRGAGKSAIESTTPLRSD